MKILLLKNTQWFLTALFLAITITAFSQKPTTWKGGTPGMKNDWHCPQNWSTSSVPGEFSDVIIPDVSTTSFSLPVIRSGIAEVNSLFIYQNGSLTIAKQAMLIVFGNAIGAFQKSVNGEGELIIHDQPKGTLTKLIGGTKE